MRFLSAWVAFNCNDIQACIDECDKIVTVTSQVNVLQGQAFLELGDFREAIESFRTAHAQEPSDALALFQLSKAQLASGQVHASWQSISQCQKLDLERESLEICTMHGLVALELGDENATKAVLSDLKGFADKGLRHSSRGAMATLKLKLAVRLNSHKF